MNEMCQSKEGRPANVVQACLLQVLTGIMTLITTINGYEHYVDMCKLFQIEVGNIEQFYVSRGISVVVTLLFAHLFYQKRNWARICFLAVTLLSVGLNVYRISLYSHVYLERITQLDTIINLFQIGISLVVCALLVTPQSRNWFTGQSA